MSSLINKAKEALSKDKGNDPRSDNYGSHKHDNMNQADPRIDSDMDHRNNPSSTYGSTTSGGQYTGSTMSGSTNDGPHSSNLANKLDPRVDSDRDNRNDPTSRVGGYGTQEGYGTQGSNPMPSSGHTTHHQTGYGGNTAAPGYGEPGLQQTGYGDNTMPPQSGYGGNTSSNAGPHSSNMTNKLDPRVDSDMDNRNDPTSRVGGYGTQDNYDSAGGNTMPHGQSMHSQTTTYPEGGFSAQTSSSAGPHSSNLANKLDPRVDSDRDNRNDPTSRVGGYGAQEGYGTQGTNPMPSSGHSTHPHAGYGDNTATSGYGQSGIQQQSGYGQPGVQQGGYGDSHTTTSTTHHSSMTPGSGNANTTAGPHNSNLMNKLDPRVDSDLDGSKTYGGNKTNY